jgi:hypothetical protein
VGEDAGISAGDLPDGTTKIFFRRGLDDPNHVESPHEIGVLAHAICTPESLRKRGEIRKIGLIGPTSGKSVVDRSNTLPKSANTGSQAMLCGTPDAPRCSRQDRNGSARSNLDEASTLKFSDELIRLIIRKRTVFLREQRGLEDFGNGFQGLEVDGLYHQQLAVDLFLAGSDLLLFGLYRCGCRIYLKQTDGEHAIQLADFVEQSAAGIRVVENRAVFSESQDLCHPSAANPA